MKLAPQPVVYRATVSGLRISAVDGAAFVDNLPSAVTDLVAANPGVYLFEAYDSSSRLLRGVLGSVGTGETLGDELVINNDFESDEPPGTTWTRGAGWAITGGKAVLTNNSTEMYQVESERSGQLIYASGTVDAFTGTVLFYSFGREVFARSSAGTGSKYITAKAYSLNDSNRSADLIASGTITGAFTSVTVKQVLTPSASGCTIVSSKGGATQNFSYKNASFAYNLSAYTIIIKKLRG